MTLKKLLPSDTRPVELISGFSLLIASILALIYHGQYIQPQLLGLHVWQFWGSIGVIFGLIQILASGIDKSEPVRAIMGWITGIYWVWTSMSHLTGTSDVLVDNIAIFCLGMACQYIFIINMMLIKKSWD